MTRYMFPAAKNLTRSQTVVNLFCTAVKAACAQGLLVSACHAADLYADNYLGIGGSYWTIQAAVDDADPGDTIWVSGTFSESVDLINKDNLQIKQYPGAYSVVDANGADHGIKMVNCDNTSISKITIQDAKRFGLDLEGGNKTCNFTDCVFKDTIGGSPNDLYGSGVRVRGGATNNITFTRCIASNNDLDGFSLNSESPNNHMTNIWLTDCDATSNGRQGAWTHYLDGLDIVDGDYSFNDASGIQIENGTNDVLIDSVTANFNSNNFGEAGIWINESTDVTVRSCTTRGNQYNILISQSETITVQYCLIKDAKVVSPTYYCGMNVSAGDSDETYPGRPNKGVRNLTISYCSFDGNGTVRGDIWYGDVRSVTNGTPTPQSEMTFFNNTLSSSGTPLVESVEFDPPVPNVREYLND